MITIRKAYPTDAYTLIQIQNIVWKNEFYDVLPNGILAEMIRKNEQIVAHLKDQIEENNRIFVALDDERVVGYVFYAKTPNVVYNAAAEIRSIYILPEYQKKQIGKKLFQEVIKEIKKLGFSSLIVYCPIPSNCLSFFLKFGGEKRELAAKNMYGYHVVCDLLFFDLKNFGKEYVGNDWNQIYLKAQENLSLLNKIIENVNYYEDYINTEIRKGRSEQELISQAEELTLTFMEKLPELFRNKFVVELFVSIFLIKIFF